MDHCYEEWRERKKCDMLHLNERRRLAMGTSVITYFKKLHSIE